MVRRETGSRSRRAVVEQQKRRSRRSVRPSPARRAVVADGAAAGPDADNNSRESGVDRQVGAAAEKPRRLLFLDLQFEIDRSRTRDIAPITNRNIAIWP